MVMATSTPSDAHDGQGVLPGDEVAVLVEDAVVGQVVLGVAGDDPAAVDDRGPFCGEPFGRPSRSGDDVSRSRYPTITGSSPKPSASRSAARERVGRRSRGVDEAPA